MKDKCKKKLTFKELIGHLEGSILFWIAGVIAIAFLISPLLLKNECISNLFSNFIKTLKIESYKSSYIETVGALIGTFLAITGALWTQRKEERRKAKQEIKEAATIIYYELKISLDDIFSLVSKYEVEKEKKLTDLNNEIKNLQKESIKEGNENYSREIREKTREVKNIESNKKLLSPYCYIEIYIHENWICNIAKLHTVLSNTELKQIYDIYGKINMCKSYLDNGYERIGKEGFADFYNFLIKDICKQNLVDKTKITYKCECLKIMCRLEKIMNGKCRGVR